MADTIAVLNPMGFAPKVTRKALAPRLPTLEGKTVYLVDCRFDDSDVFLEQMRAWFAEHLPGRPSRGQADLERLPATTTRPPGRRSRRGVHAAIVGVGH